MTAAFMVDSIEDAWEDGGVLRVGAMFWWHHGRRGNDADTNPRPMPHLAVQTAAGIACLDCPATKPPGGRYWERSGEPPNVTVTPSLDIGPGIWHGFLTAGVLTP